VKKLIEWLYIHYVLLPEIRKHYGKEAEIYSLEVIGHTPIDSDTINAQTYKDVFRPQVH